MYLNHGCCINEYMLELYFPWVHGVDKPKACKLLYPDDPQDDPYAMELMLEIISLGHPNPRETSLCVEGCPTDPDTLVDFRAIGLLGHVLDNLLQPFINVHLTLSKQVVCLSCFAHLLYASYQDQHHHLMPNQLYYDSQSIVKTTVMNIAKQQKLDSNSAFSFLNLSDDALELLFTFLCMSGGHNNAVNYRQAVDWLGAAHNIGGVFARQPDLAHGHHCLNLS
ncbi:hypothetical protein PAXRUDRAFT_29491 [Paxillus rubicundulus Ve08.2h10]|uniref:Uncharacterized protein n=1 Tax=Paxillus rubicundulus Ve08.2h10 TaxID=930991 RepID=A0A0D0E6V9_9AGAM|nr:hypothetical protein PAXRUDRAFT_29491 [Paxillus rubicundulus Ve08.2h10]